MTCNNFFPFLIIIQNDIFPRYIVCLMVVSGDIEQKHTMD